MRILLAEDDEFLSGGIALALRDSGYSVDEVPSGLDADIAAATTDYDLIVLDLGLPRVDGLEVLRRVRGRGQTLPILIVTARDAVDDRVLGLDMGANDYLVKPFELPELEARIRALLRKAQWANRLEVSLGRLRYNVSARTAYVDNTPLELSARELAVLEILLKSPGRFVSKVHIIEHLSSWENEVSFNAVDIIMHRLRKKLEASGLQIRTARNLGYAIEEE